MKPLSKVDMQMYEVRRHIENGWCRGVREDEDGNVCIWGAIDRTTPDEAERAAIVERLEKALIGRIYCGLSLMAFNDSRTKEAVLALVQEAIEAGG